MLSHLRQLTNIMALTAQLAFNGRFHHPDENVYIRLSPNGEPTSLCRQPSDSTLYAFFIALLVIGVPLWLFHCRKQDPAVVLTLNNPTGEASGVGRNYTDLSADLNCGPRIDGDCDWPSLVTIYYSALNFTVSFRQSGSLISVPEELVNRLRRNNKYNTPPPVTAVGFFTRKKSKTLTVTFSDDKTPEKSICGGAPQTTALKPEKKSDDSIVCPLSDTGEFNKIVINLPGGIPGQGIDVPSCNEWTRKNENGNRTVTYSKPTCVGKSDFIGGELVLFANEGYEKQFEELTEEINNLTVSVQSTTKPDPAARSALRGNR